MRLLVIGPNVHAVARSENFHDRLHVESAAVLKTAFYNTTIKKNGNIEWVITEYQPTKPYDLSCLIRDTTRNPSTIVIAGLSGSKMIVSTNTAQLQSWGYYGRVSIKDNLTIVIDNVTFEEQGREFQCDLQESNRFDPKIETKYILALVLDPPAVVTTSFSSMVNLTEDDSLTLSCNMSGNPAPVIDWVRDAAVTGTARQNRSTGANGFFVKSYFEQSDVTWLYHDKQITCKGTNQGGTTERMTQLKVKFSPKNTSILVSPSIIEEKMTFAVTCGAVANPSVTTYYISGPSGTVQSSSSTHNFTALNCSSDSGSYSCVASNSQGNGTAVSKQVDIYGPPTIHTPPRDTTKDENETVKLYCYAAGCPSPNITWRKHGDSSFTKSGSLLMLTNLKLSDAGIYICEASNAGEPTTQNATLNVRFAPKNTTIRVSPSSIKEKMIFTVTCSAVANPQVSTYFISGPAGVVQSSTGVHNFTAQNCSSQSGTYSCTASNSLGNGTTESKQVDIYGPPTIHTPPRDATVNENGNVTLYCYAAGCPSPNITWKKHGDNSFARTGNMLMLTSVKREHAGAYICEAANMEKTRRENATLTVYYKPSNTTLSSSAQNGVAIVEANVTFTCKTDALPAARYIFHHNGAMVQNSTSDKYVRTVECNVHNGNYSCEAVNFLGKDMSNIATLTVTGRPTIALKPISQNINEGSTVSFTCNAVGCPKPNVTWRKASGGSILHTGNTYTIVNATRSHTGVYICETKHGNMSDQANATLTVEYMPENFTLVPQSGDIENGKPLHLNCSADGVPAPTYMFYRVYQDGSNKNVSSTGSMSSGKLVVDSIMYESVSHYRAEYKCIASNTRGKKDGSATFNVLVSPTNVTVSPSNVIVNETQDVILMCSVAAANPAVNFTWEKDSSSTVLSRNATLKLTGVTKEQAGTYRCMADNSISPTPGTDSSVLEVQHKPYNVTITADKKTATHKSQVVITCVAFGYPKPEFTFHYVNGSTETVVSDADSRTTGVLNISSVPFDGNYKAIYKCIPSNKLGNGDVKNVSVEVEVPPTDVTVSHTTLTVNEADNVKVTCHVRYANPPPTFIWTKSGTAVRNMKELNFSSINTGDAGPYRCSVTNKLGRKMADTKIIVQYAPLLNKSLPSIFKECVNGMVTINCSVMGLPAPSLMLYKGTDQKSSSNSSHLSYKDGQLAEADFGLYYCIARNLLGSDRMNITVQKRDIASKPQTVKVFKKGPGELEVTWTKPECEGVNGITSYVVKYQRPGDPTVNEKVFKASDCCKVNVALTAETQYRVWVVTRDSTGKDGDASAATLVTTAASTKPKENDKVAIYAGAAGGAVFFILLVILAACLISRQKKQQQNRKKRNPQTDVARDYVNVESGRGNGGFYGDGYDAVKGKGQNSGNGIPLNQVGQENGDTDHYVGPDGRSAYASVKKKDPEKKYEPTLAYGNTGVDNENFVADSDGAYDPASKQVETEVKPKEDEKKNDPDTDDWVIIDSPKDSHYAELSTFKKPAEEGSPKPKGNYQKTDYAKIEDLGPLTPLNPSQDDEKDVPAT